jgi:hypothetical protein
MLFFVLSNKTISKDDFTSIEKKKRKKNIVTQITKLFIAYNVSGE